jgi:quercetin dioxygenase-like cupin family protein
MSSRSGSSKPGGSVDKVDNHIYHIDNHIYHCREAAMPVVRDSDTRRSETPNAVMTTLASPTLGGAGQSLWRVEMRPGQAGPPHTFDREQVWTVLAGGATVELAGEAVAVAAGDTIVMPAGAPRRVVSDPGAGMTAIVTAPGDARASRTDGTDAGVPPWIV